MAQNKKTPRWYGEMMKETIPKKKLGRNCVVAFCFGGLLCAGAELADYWLAHSLSWGEETRSTAILLVVIGLVALLTGLGVYDKLGQKLGAGLAVPISGFANSVTASMLEHRSEGMVLGSGCNSFKLAGAVVVFGIASATICSLVALLLGAV